MDDKAPSMAAPDKGAKKSRSKSNTGEEKKKASRPSKKKASGISTDGPIASESECSSVMPSTESNSQAAATPETAVTPRGRKMSGTESDDMDEQQHSQATNGKSGNESDGSIDGADRSLNTIRSASSAGPEKKGGRTTIKPLQLDVSRPSWDPCRSCVALSDPMQSIRIQFEA
jgi:hypothetical protein